MATPPIAYFARLQFVDGTPVELPATGVVLFVGPNNAGKSTALLEIKNFVRSRTHASGGGRVFESADLTVTENDEALTAWLQTFSAASDESDSPDTISLRHGDRRLYGRIDQVAHQIRVGGSEDAISFLLLDGHGRLSFDGEAPDLMSPNTDSPQPHITRLWLDQALESRLADFTRTMFDRPVTLLREGKRAALYYGELPSLSQPPTPDELEQVSAVPRVEEQGDGVKSLVSMGMALLLGKEPLVAFDEPDAHLHPPQARQAGRLIADRGERSQFFVATHSLDFVLGVLDGNANVTVIRLERDSGAPRATVLSADNLRTYWRDTLVRYSGALAGLMHRGVVCCESDADCRYFEIALDYYREGEPAHDLRFVYAGGKGGLKKLIPVLRSIRVPISVVTDFDLLREWKETAVLYELLGGKSESLRANWKQVNKALSSPRDARTVAHVAAELADAAAELPPTDTYSTVHKKSFDKVLKQGSGWADAKRKGLDALHGEAWTAAKALLQQLKRRGIHVLPVGELESLHAEVPRKLHGPPYVAEVIERGLYAQLDRRMVSFVRGLTKTT